jgi:hypothetical protein
MKPFGELNPKVWQGDYLLGIDDKRPEMFQNGGPSAPVMRTESVHAPDYIARHRCVRSPRFLAATKWVQGGLAIALTNGDGPKLFSTAKRFSCVLGMLSSLAAQVRCPT